MSSIARHWDMPVEERRVSVQEIVEALEKGTLEAAFGAGTAVVVSPFAVIAYDGIDYELPALTDDSFAIRAKNFLTKIRTGQIADPFGWVVKI